MLYPQDPTRYKIEMQNTQNIHALALRSKAKGQNGS